MLMGNYARVDLGFKKGKGAILWSLDGKDYVDFGSGIGVCSLGHGNKKLSKTIKNQAKALLHTSNIYKIKPQEKLADKMCDLLGEPYYLFFSNSGAEANECAIKLARKYGNSFEEKKYEIITLGNSFHGRTIATLKLTGQEKFHSKDFAPYPDAFKFFNTIDEIIENLNDKTVAVMVELVQGEGGINPLNVAEIQKLAQILKEKDILFITDEVQCGVYRTGEFVTSQIYGVTPDIITFAKGLGGGVSIGACASKKDIFKAGDHGSTFGGNFLAMSVGITVLKEMKKLKKSGKLDETIKEFKNNLDELVANYSNIFKSRVGLGLMQGLVLKDPENLTPIFNKALEKRVLVLKSGKDTLRFLPPLNISKKEIKKGFKRLKNALNELNLESK
ncbi:aspartate aminotransferase family protein [Campylobacter fetus]|uniref:aspartate aminotransferase family protein n=1 Tax=Campylobacter fetus TaxID=196 RepID=UPI0003C26B01|nr:aspartate aminotransferase family protein [Campylobacter fetus]AGZ81782.1 N-succinyldiaminopimelate-aminotransferase / acetylornithine transaminase [Campylobacter fetus subsp. testudinum 03-427]OCS07474.1 acetylornithine aminotransferase [Campylobacter fetus subsp. testudinum]OCS09207.1 acetylornithine aminotransferase [Campylobacter fetus subsp. testudinum]OCS10750.1 acetylornithine aminotransferase [Campylobacter fetus subsp. testudinum]OCS11580.1 acetylornithine aminotransferase [Campylo